ncbi:FG-GAP repeat protein [Engelhardtia mirabilis]|uniref:Kelch motif protein n=1 Tax=Engelhardtia mirabilis TaxID=2528011 RepID=A0A518BNB2_9BACT|nr:hypothetical protein Pla133_35690 [Planctomycetes bacterium Pla133]QDV02797.1 hypothetical protein Pla86_35670 [Planctomycetes bacterium Pla86]
MLPPSLRSAALAVALAVCPGGVAFAQCGETLAADSPGLIDDHFGESMDVHGKRLVVAAPRDGDAGHWAGAAWVFERVMGQWQLEQKLVPTDLPPGAVFSHAQVALEDEWLFAASVWEPTPDLNGDRGVVRVYRRDQSGWQPFQKLWQPGTGASSGFAARIEADQDQLVVSARGQQKLYLYGFDGSQWVLRQGLTDPEPAAQGDWLGVDVAMDDKCLATSSVREVDGDGVVGNSPARLVVYIFERGFQTSNTDDYGFLGRIDFAASQALQPGALTIRHDKLAVQGIVSPESQEAELHLFDMSLGAEPFQRLKPPDGVDVEFGRSLAFAGDDLLLVGGRGSSVLGPIGRAVTFRQTPLGWQAESEFRPLATDGSTKFATKVRAKGDDDLFVASRIYQGPSITGEVHVYDALQSPSLQVDVSDVSLSAGGVQTLSLRCCDDLAGCTYLVLGALSLPPADAGIALDGSHLPLVIDIWFLTTLAQANAGIFSSTVGLLDAKGEAQAQIQVPAGSDPSLAGIELFHAALVLEAPGSGRVLSTTVPTRLGLAP